MDDGPPSPSHAVIVAGPTASGKSALAMAIAETFNGVVINADSMQVYRELRVLTARPSEADEARVPHRLYGVMSAAERCSAGRWLSLACDAIAGARSAGRLPVLVGGTGMYLHALTQGLAEIPAIPPHVRGEGEVLYGQIGEQAFRNRLAALDPEAAARIAAADRQRLIRAWEVATATGRPLAAWQATAPVRRAAMGRVVAVMVMPPREAVYAACDARFDGMIDQGALAEVRRLMDLALSPDMPAMKAVGVRQLSRHLAGESSLIEAISGAKQASRNYAKRQVTWLRHHKVSGNEIYTKFPERECEEILSFIRQFLLTRPD